MFPVELNLQIVGAMGNDRDPRLWFQREYLAQALEAAGVPFDQLGTVWARIDDPERVNEVMSRIDEMFRNSEAETATETEKSFFGNFFGNLQGFVTIILIVTGTGRALHRVHRRQHGEHVGARAGGRDRGAEGARLPLAPAVRPAGGRGGAALGAWRAGPGCC